MGFQLHILDAPEVRTPQEADAFLARESDQPPALNQKFTRFRDAITQDYPDLSEEDEDGDNDDNVWEEGLSELTSDGRVTSVVIKVDLTDEALVLAIAHAANTSGLHCYDDEGQVLYRVDGQRVDRRGQ